MIINKKSLKDFIINLLFLIPFFKPEFIIVKYPFLSKIYLLFELIVLVFLLLFYVKNKFFSKIIIYIFIYFAILFFSTLMYSFTNLGNFLKMTISTLGLCLICDLGLRTKTKSFLTAINFLLFVYIAINLLTIIFFPNGLYIGSGSGYYENWFLGYRNIHILYIFPFIIFSICLSYYKFNKISRFVYGLLFLCTFSLIIAKSSTSIVGIFLISIYILFEKWFLNKKILNIKTYIISHVLLFFSIIIFRVQKIFSFLIVDILKKDITFTNRVFIWDDVLGFIKNKPLLGYGYELGKDRYLRSIRYPSYHAHNQILEIIYKSGFVGLLSFCIIIFSVVKKLYNYKSSKIGSFLSYSLFTLLIMTLTEVYSYEYFMYLFVLFYNVEKLFHNHERCDLNNE